MKKTAGLEKTKEGLKGTAWQKGNFNSRVRFSNRYYDHMIQASVSEKGPNVKAAPHEKLIIVS